MRARGVLFGVLGSVACSGTPGFDPMFGVDLASRGVQAFIHLEQPYEAGEDRAGCTVIEETTADTPDGEAVVEFARLTYDDAGRLVTGETVLSVLAHVPDGLPLYVDRDRFHQAYTYDADGRAVSFTEDREHRPDDGEPVFSRTYTWEWIDGASLSDGRFLVTHRGEPGEREPTSARTDWSGATGWDGPEDPERYGLWIDGPVDESRDTEGVEAPWAGRTHAVVETTRIDHHVEVVHDGEGRLRRFTEWDELGILSERLRTFDRRGRLVESVSEHRLRDSRETSVGSTTYVYEGRDDLPVEILDTDGQNRLVLDGRRPRSLQLGETAVVLWVWQDEVDTSDWTYGTPMAEAFPAILDHQAFSTIFLRLVDASGRHMGTLTVVTEDGGPYLAIEGRMVERGGAPGRPSLITEESSWTFRHRWPVDEDDVPDVRTRAWACP